MSLLELSPTSLPQPDFEILRQMVALPVAIFTEGTIALGQEVWTWVADARPDLEARLMVEVSESWSQTIQKKQGLFSSFFKCDTSNYL